MKSVNIKFPLVDDKVKNNFLGSNFISKDGLTSNLVLLLLTDIGERYYMSDYGTNLRKFIFEPNDSITHSQIEEEIRETVKKYIPELSIVGVEILNDKTEDNQVNVNVDFKYVEDVFSEVGRLELTI